MRRILGTIAVTLALACTRRDQAPPVHQEQVVDSAIPREEALRRFREGLPEVREFTGGAADREALLREVASAVAARDTTRLGTLVLSRAEFAWLYYPTAAQGLPPYDLAPALYWFTIDSRNHRALAKLLEVDRATLRYDGADCGPTPTREGENEVWGPCVFRVTTPDQVGIRLRYLSLLVGRKGSWKVLQYGEGESAEESDD